MLTLPFQISTQLCFHENEADVETESDLTEEENFSQCLKILTRVTTEDENELAERKAFPKTLTSESFDNDNKRLYLLQCFLYKDKRRKDGNNFQTDTVSGFQNIKS